MVKNSDNPILQDILSELELNQITSWSPFLKKKNQLISITVSTCNFFQYAHVGNLDNSDIS